MQAIGDFLLGIGNMIANLVGIVSWFIMGVGKVGDLLHAALFVLGESLDFLPDGVSAAILGVCGGLVVLRILGRS